MYHIFFIYLIYLYLASGGILVPQPGIEPGPSAVRAQSLNHWTTREFPNRCFFGFWVFLPMWPGLWEFPNQGLNQGHGSESAEP